MKDSNPPQERVSLEQVTKAARDYMEVERDASLPQQEPEPLTLSHTWAKGKGEVVKDPDNLLEETAEELEDQVLINSIDEDDLSLLETPRAFRNRLKVSIIHSESLGKERPNLGILTYMRNRRRVREIRELGKTLKRVLLKFPGGLNHPAISLRSLHLSRGGVRGMQIIFHSEERSAATTVKPIS